MAKWAISLLPPSLFHSPRSALSFSVLSLFFACQSVGNPLSFLPIKAPSLLHSSTNSDVVHAH